MILVIDHLSQRSSESMYNSSFQIGSDGGIGLPTNGEEHIRNMIISILFTSPGERINQPEFGCGLKDLVFANATPMLDSVIDFVIRGGIERWMGELISIDDMQTHIHDEKIIVKITYTIKHSLQQERISVEF